MVARWAHNPEVVGSNPAPATIWSVSLEAYDVCLSRRRSGVRIPYGPPFFYGSIAQLVEQRTENPCVAGSTPAGATILYMKKLCLGIPGGTVVKNLPANAGVIGDTGSIPGLGRSPGEGNDNPLQYSCLENPMDRGAWQATVHGIVKS